MTTQQTLVDELLHSYFHGRAEAMLAVVTDDFEWINVALPAATVRGCKALEAKLAVPNLGLPVTLEAAEHEIYRSVEAGAILMHERVDRLRFAGRWLETPCAAAFDFRDGLIARWTDYYDIGLVIRFMRSIGVELDTSRWW